MRSTLFLLRSTIPNEKKSTGGAADRLGVGGFADAFGLSSKDTFALPLAKEGGRKGSDDMSLVAVLEFAGSTCIDTLGSLPSSCSCPRFSSVNTLCSGVVIGLALKINPDPFPPPKTRSGCGATGTFCFGAGSMVNNEEAPAPVFCRFAAGRSSSMSSLSSLSSFESAGSPMVIFFGARFVALGGGSEILDEDELLVDGGGRSTTDFGPAGWTFLISCFSFSLSLSLPLP